MGKKATVTAADIAARRKQVSQYLLRGWNIDAMAVQLSVTPKTIEKDVQWLKERWEQQALHNYGTVQMLTLERLNAATEAIWDEVENGNTKAINTMLKIEQQRARLVGAHDGHAKRFQGMTNEELISYVKARLTGNGPQGLFQPGQLEDLLLQMQSQPSPDDLVIPPWLATNETLGGEGPRKLTPEEEERYDWDRWARPKQRIPEGTDWFIWLMLCGRGFGKALDVNTPIPTPNGWTTMGELKDGDAVFGDDGKVYNVVQAHPVLMDRPCYRVIFSDGSEIVADEDHYWATNTKYDAHPSVTMVRTTGFIRDSLWAKHRIIAAPVLDAPTREWTIVDVIPCQTRPVRCITVDSPSRLYLAGESMIPTHNTRTGAETMRRMVETKWGWEPGKGMPENPTYALVGRTAKDVRDTMVEGPAGLLTVCPPNFKPIYEPSKCRLTFPNGVIITTYSADEPDSLRGPNFFGAWCDEIAAWANPEAYAMLMLALRLGNRPICVLTTTPKPVQIVRDLYRQATVPKQKKIILTTGGSMENRDNLAGTFFDTILEQYQGTRLEQQEIYGKLLEDNPNALWQLTTIDNNRIKQIDVNNAGYRAPIPEMLRVVIAIDPQSKKRQQGEHDDRGMDKRIVGKKASHLTGMVVAGQGVDGHYYILADLSHNYKPEEWARKAAWAYYEFGADKIVAEVNNGGDMVETALKAFDSTLPFESVWASRGKILRAEPVAMLYDKGQVHHYGTFPELEEQMTQWEPGMESPDRLDALVWAMTALMSSASLLAACVGPSREKVSENYRQVMGYL